MASMPYLTNIEKKWISFQILYGLSQIHNKGLCHGDIKLENILMSSIGSVFLCDMAPYKPAYIQQDDVGSFTYYFGTNSSIKSCYLAPERLVDRYELQECSNSNSIYKVTTAMDVFSVAAAIAELFLEDMLFDHPKLLLYKNGKFNLEYALKKIKDKKLEDLLVKMMKVNPNERIDLGECFKYFAEEISPISFPRMLIHFNTLIVSSDYWKPDKRIGLIYKHWKQIWKVVCGPDSEVPELYRNLNNVVLNDLILDSPFTKHYIENYSIIFDLKNELPNENLLFEEGESFTQKNPKLSLSKFKDNNNSECSLIIVNYILTAILIAKYSSTKIVGMEILRIFSNKLTDITKIQLIIPYLVKLLKDYSNLVRLTALHEIILILQMINENDLILPSSDYNFFDAYIFPSILELYSSNEPSLILAFANIIDKLTDLEHKFLQITLRSRFHNMKHQHIEGGNNFSKGSFNFHSINSGKDRGEEIIHAYDADLYEFKSNLFKIIEDILSKNEDIDTQLTLIRKLPNLMLFYGRRETNNFSKFIIAHFNKKDWIIQREILKSIPSLIVTLGETALNQFIVPCMELIINNNLSELKIYEMIHTMHLLLKMEYLETFRGIDLFKKILPFIMHPNIWIRNEVINFGITLINLLSEGEVYTYLRPDFKNYLYMPFIILTSDLIKGVTKERLSRVIYELYKKEIDYFFQRNFEDEEAFQLLEGVLNFGRENSKYNDEQINSNDLESKLVRLRASLEGINASTIVKKEFAKVVKYYNNQEDIRFLERTFLGKLISLSSIIQTLSLPASSSRRFSVNFSLLNDNVLSQENFKIKYLFKALDIVVKEEVLDEIDAEVSYNQGIGTHNVNHRESSNTRGESSGNINPHSASASGNNLLQRQNTYINPSGQKSGNYNSMANWKPHGKLISTLYDHEMANSNFNSNNQIPTSTSKSVSVEKLLNLNIENSNKFLSFASDGHILLWDIIGNENDISVEKSASTKTSLGLSFSKAICNVDSNQFAVASKNSIEVFRLESVKSNFYLQNLYDLGCSNVSSSSNPASSEESDISCLIANYKNKDNKQLIYCNAKGKLQIYDMRVNKASLDYDIGIQRGLVSCIDFGKDDRSLYIGTLGGYIMNYDFRLNSVIGSYKYNDNTPIIGLQTYMQCKGKEYDLFSTNLNPNFNDYLLIWTASNDHELGLWNLNTLNCDVIMKVNSLQGKDIKPLSIEIPNLYKENSELKDEKNNIEILYNNLNKYSHTLRFNTFATRNIILNNINSDFYSHSNKRLSKLSNLFEISNTCQVAFSPLNTKLNENINNFNVIENVPYVISAGNDMTIRYWDISKDGLFGSNNQNSNLKRSYLINAPNKIDNCIFSTSSYDSTVILQSNEISNSKIPKKDVSSFSEYQNYNGVNFHLGIQNEFDENLEVLKYCTKISDAAHKNVITDMLTMNVCNTNHNLLISSSWDGTVKLWK